MLLFASKIVTVEEVNRVVGKNAVAAKRSSPFAADNVGGRAG
jgi:hypothetical protein